MVVTDLIDPPPPPTHTPFSVLATSLAPCRYLKPAVYLLPFWIRFMQCVATAIAVPAKRGVQSKNALKYVVSMVVVASSASIKWFPAVRDTRTLPAFALIRSIVTCALVFVFGLGRNVLVSLTCPTDLVLDCGAPILVSIMAAKLKQGMVPNP